MERERHYFAAAHDDLLGPLRQCEKLGCIPQLHPLDLERHHPEIRSILHVEAYNSVKFILGLLGSQQTRLSLDSNALVSFISDFEDSSAKNRKQVLASGYIVIPVMYEELLYAPEQALNEISRGLDIPLRPPFPEGARRYAVPRGYQLNELADKLSSLHLSDALSATTSLREEEELAARRTLKEAATAWVDGAYYSQAEHWFDAHWTRYALPFVENCDLSSTLDLACGHGRAVAKLAGNARQIHLVDLSEDALRHTQSRFGDIHGNCRLHYHRTSGTQLQAISDCSLTFTWCWDSAVHFDKCIVRDYLRECARILVSGGKGLFHHSNFGLVQKHSHWRSNPHWRSNMTADLFRQYCTEFGLIVEKQEFLDWGPWEGRTYKDLDCISQFRKP